MRRLWGVLIGLALAEALLRLALLIPAVRGPLTEGTGEAGAELRWLYTWYAQWDAPQFEADAALGWRLARRELGSSDAPMSVDEDGARRPSPPRAPTPGALRVTAYGDSFAFAWDVDDEASWHAQLMARTAGGVRPVEVVNLGVPGYDLGQVVLRRAAESDGWAPQVEVLLLHELLGQRAVLPFEHFRRPLLRAELGEREPVGVPIPTVEEEALARILTPHLWNLAQVGALRARGGPTSRFLTEAAPRSRALLDRFIDDVRADGRIPVIVWLDLPHVLETGLGSSAWMPRCGSEGRDVRCVDAGPALRALVASGGELTAGTHFSPAANGVIAGVVLEALHGL